MCWIGFGYWLRWSFIVGHGEVIFRVKLGNVERVLGDCLPNLECLKWVLHV